MDPDKVAIAQTLFTSVGVVGVAGMIGWVVTTWMRIKNGYPLDGAWGKALYPREGENAGRVEQLVRDNTQLRAELGSVKDRLANVERIVTDGSHRLDAEISALRSPAN